MTTHFANNVRLMESNGTHLERVLIQCIREQQAAIDGHYLGGKHIKLVEAVNNSKTEAEHRDSELRLQWWRDGVADSGVRLSYMAADRHYLNQGIDRPMCCGVFLDWRPEA